MAETRWGVIQDLVLELGSVCGTLQRAEYEAAITQVDAVVGAAVQAKHAAGDAVSRAANAQDQDTGDFAAAVVAARESIRRAQEIVAEVGLTITQAQTLRMEAARLAERRHSLKFRDK